MYDRFNRRIHYLRVSVTDRCDLRCRYCMPAGGIVLKDRREILSYEDILRVVRVAAGLGIDKVRLTGGEPLVRRGMVSLVERMAGIPGIRELCMTTNGVQLKGVARSLKQAGLDRLNISLDTLDREKYRHLTRVGDLDKVLAGVEAAREAGFQNTKINMVLIPGFNDDEIPRMKRFCSERGLVLQRINRYVLADINTRNRLLPAERPLDCSLCNRLRLLSDGRLKPCLFSDIEIPVDLGDIEGSIRRAVDSKPGQGSFNRTTQNWQIGG